jgi:anti-anti-sigma factor
MVRRLHSAQDAIRIGAPEFGSRGFGEGEIRTPETFDSLLAFQASAFDHSATSPGPSRPFASAEQHSVTAAQHEVQEKEGFLRLRIAKTGTLGDVKQLRFAGDIDIARYPEIHGQFEAALAELEPVLVDLSEVDRVDSTFLSELLVFARRREAIGREVGVLITTANLGRIFAITNLDYRMRVYHDRAVAERELSKGANS